MSHSITSRRTSAPAPAREPDRISPERRLAAASAAVDALAVAPSLGAVCAAAASRAPGATSAGRAVRARPARARRSACRRGAPRRSPAPAGVDLPSSGSSRSERGAADTATAWPSWRACLPGAVARSAAGRSSSAPRSRPPRRRQIERRPHRRPGRGMVGDEDGAGRPVQPPAAVRRTSVSAARPAGALRGHGHAGRAQALAKRSRERRQVEVDRLHLEVSHRCARAAPGRPRGSPPGPRRTSAPTPA